MSTDIDTIITGFAAEHHGVFTPDVARAANATRRERQRRVDAGRWVRLHDEVYVVAGTPPSWRRDLVAACFAGGADAAASHRSAAELWGLPGGRTHPPEITCHRWRRNQEDGLVVHESKVLETLDVRIVDGIPTVCPELTLVQLGAVHGRALVEMAYDAACRRSLVTEQSVRALLGRLGARGRNGIGRLRTIVDDRSALAAIPESPMESKLLRTLRELGLPDPVPQFEVVHDGCFVARVDFAYPDARLAIEYDSDEHHIGVAQHHRDAARRRRLDRADWHVIVVTGTDVRSGCIDVAQTILARLART